MINNNLMNILTQQQQSFEGKIDTSALEGKAGLMNPDMAAEFMGELQKHMSTEEQLNLINTLQTGEQVDIANTPANESIKKLLAQVNADPKITQDILASIGEQPIPVAKGTAPAVEAKVLEAQVQQLPKLQIVDGKVLTKPSAESKAGLVDSSAAKISLGDLTGEQSLDSGEDFIKTLDVNRKLAPKVAMSKSVKAKQYAKNAAPNSMIRFNQDVQVSAQAITMDPIKGAKIKSLNTKSNTLKNNFGEVKTDTSKLASVEGQTLTDVLSMDTEKPMVNNVFKMDNASTSLDSSNSKVFEMSQVVEADISNTDQLINKISDYIIQSKVSNEPRVELSMNHQELGKVDIMVEKASNDMLNISITPNTVDGKSFFMANKGELLSVLNNSGIQIADFKLDTSSSNNNLSQNNSNQSFGQNSQGQHQSQKNQQDAESQRRQELWDMFSNREVA